MPDLGLWPLRCLWLLLPLVAGPSLADALSGRPGELGAVASVGLWALWAVALLATMVPHPLSLTCIRVLAPAATVTIVWSAMLADQLGPALAAAGLTVAATGVAMLASTADVMVDGPSYGSERRFALRAPGLLLVGPIPLAWLVVTAGGVTGPLLLAAEEWVAGGVALVVGLPAAALASRSLHALSRRWLVFVPAGFVVHDLLVLEDPVLVPSRQVRGIGAAPVRTDAVDLTQGAAGLAVQVVVDPPIRLPLRRGDPLHRADAFLVTPSLPGRFLDEAGRRRLPV